MGYIYKLTNLINNKVYIGQTRTPIKIRMNKHYSRACNEGCITGVDAAIRKYGKENFSVEVLCECANSDLNKKEIEYITSYGSYNSDKGYNLTIGGDNSWSYLGLNEEEVISKYKELKSIKRVAKYYACSVASISNILHTNNVTLFKPTGRVENFIWGAGNNKRAIKIVELGRTFISIQECADWLIKQGYCKVKVPKYVSKGLCNVLKHKRKSYHGFTVEYIK